VGTRRAFRIMGLISIGCGICYYLLNKLWLEREEVESSQADDEGKCLETALNGRVNGSDENFVSRRS